MASLNIIVPDTRNTIITRNIIIPNITSYQNYKNFEYQKVESEICCELTSHAISSLHYGAFKNINFDALKKHAPIEKKYLKPNHSEFVTNKSSKASM